MSDKKKNYENKVGANPHDTPTPNPSSLPPDPSPLLPDAPVVVGGIDDDIDKLQKELKKLRQDIYAKILKILKKISTLPDNVPLKIIYMKHIQKYGDSTVIPSIAVIPSTRSYDLTLNRADFTVFMAHNVDVDIARISVANFVFADIDAAELMNLVESHITEYKVLKEKNALLSTLRTTKTSLSVAYDAMQKNHPDS